jgi:hypothetical protein
MGQAEAGDVDQNLGLIALHKDSRDQLVHAFALDGGEGLDCHTAFFHQILSVRGAEYLEFRNVIFSVSHNIIPFLSRCWRHGPSSVFGNHRQA